MLPVYVHALPRMIADDIVRYLAAHAIVASAEPPTGRAIWVLPHQAMGSVAESAAALLVLGEGVVNAPDGVLLQQMTLPMTLAGCITTLRGLGQAVGEQVVMVRGGWVLSMAMRQLECQGAASISLTDKEATLLYALLEASPEMVGKQDLLREVWHYDEAIDTHTLETHIYRLRGKLALLFGPDEDGKSAGILTSADGYSFLR